MGAYVLQRITGGFRVVDDADGAPVNDLEARRVPGRGYWAIFRGRERVSGMDVMDRVLDRLEERARAGKCRRRACLCCGTSFMSEGAHHRMCNLCRRRSHDYDPAMLACHAVEGL